MLPQQAVMVKENRIDTHAHVFAASCAVVPIDDERARSVVLRDTPDELFRF